MDVDHRKKKNNCRGLIRGRAINVHRFGVVLLCL